MKGRLLEKLERIYGVKGWKAIKERQKLERKRKKDAKVRLAAHRQFAASGPRLVRKDKQLWEC